MAKILIVNHTEFFRGGAERSNLLLAESLLVRGHHPTLLFPSRVLPPNAKQEVYPLICTPKHQGKPKRSGFLEYLNVMRRRLVYISWLIQHRKLFEEFDFVVCVTNRSCSEFIFFKFLLNKKTFYFNRGYDSNVMFKYILFNFADRIITLNANRRMPYVFRDDILVASNYLNWEDYPYSLEKPAKVVSVGRANELKGIDVFSFISSNLPDVLFNRYGHGCGNYKFSENVMAKEFADQFEIYSGGSIFLSTSRSEDFPRVFIEAIASGLLIVALHFEGIERFRKDGITFWFTRDPLELKGHLLSALRLSSSVRQVISSRNLEVAKKMYSDNFLNDLF